VICSELSLFLNTNQEGCGLICIISKLPVYPNEDSHVALLLRMISWEVRRVGVESHPDKIFKHIYEVA
jgi:hypothetical protein